MKVGVIHFAVSDIQRALDFYVNKLELIQKKFLSDLENTWKVIQISGSDVYLL